MIKPRDIVPFYFPSSVLFVDDNADYLANLALALDPDLACRLHSNPLVSLATLNQSPPASALVDRYCSLFQFQERPQPGQRLMEFDLERVLREVYNPGRFDLVTVLVIDYAMPGLDGLEYCRHVRDPAVKKILLTGKADEKIAVQAFNQGLIDRFLPKQSPDLVMRLTQDIRALQQAYFRDLCQPLANVLALASHPFLRDEAFSGWFGGLCRQLGVIEHYVHADPAGLLLLDDGANAQLLVVLSEQDLVAQHDEAFDLGAPPQVLEALRQGSGLLYRHACRQFPMVDDNWYAALYPAEAFHGRDLYYYALIPQPAGVSPGTIRSYRRYLERLDCAG
ncbi:response regulator [Chitiniphilus shinanonensis]|uniref:Response regulator n=1 Tax=Chitiniphilus shinanonensis TaxID=553088 RepID=A0ABQ6BTS8_9NEIS|nr:response regulator [Chitiniphilus shinanonensis]GLS04894.1 response regulator [Chitiniphilus shinanonensis]